MLFDAIIIGGGFSGAAAAIQLLRCGCPSVALIEPRERLGEGVAYSTREPFHLLNVPAHNMSALPDEPGHFAAWAEAHHGIAPDDFAPRRLYADYMRDLIAALAGDRLTRIQGRAIAAAPAGDKAIRITLAGGDFLAGRNLVLAGGNLPGRNPPLMNAAHAAGVDYVRDPWSSEGRAAVRAMAQAKGDVLVLGTGLTMVDVCLTLAGHGFGGRILATSRRGLIPRAHQRTDPAPLESPPPARLGELVRHTRDRARSHGWRAAVDALRPHSNALWSGFDLAERRRFLRHLRPYWDVHRHRIAPAVAERLDALMRDGRVAVVAGRSRFEDGELVIARRDGAGELRRRVGAIVNCTGPGRDIADADDPLLQSLFESGLARPDPLGIGIDVCADSRVTGQESIYAVGPLTRGAFWEIVAVPDIRGQTLAIAEAISARAR